VYTHTTATRSPLHGHPLLGARVSADAGQMRYVVCCWQPDLAAAAVVTTPSCLLATTRVASAR